MKEGGLGVVEESALGQVQPASQPRGRRPLANTTLHKYCCFDWSWDSLFSQGTTGVTCELTAEQGPRGEQYLLTLPSLCLARHTRTRTRTHMHAHTLTLLHRTQSPHSVCSSLASLEVGRLFKLSVPQMLTYNTYNTYIQQ